MSTRLAAYTRRPGGFAARWIAAGVLIFDQLRHAVIGALFWIEAKAQGEAFNVETFGEFALLFPAEFWAAAMMAGSILTFAGITHPPQKWAIVVGSLVNVAQFTGLAYSAIFTGGEQVVGLYASSFAAAAIITLWAGLTHDRR